MQYDAEVKNEANGKDCILDVGLIHPIDVEVVLLTTIFTITQSFPVITMVLSVGDLIGSDGKPSKMRNANLRTATFTGDYKFDFKLSDRGNMTIKAVLGIKDKSIRRYIQRFVAGQFELTFSREDRPANRTYAVLRAPPSDVSSKLLECDNR